MKTCSSLLRMLVIRLSTSDANNCRICARTANSEADVCPLPTKISQEMVVSHPFVSVCPRLPCKPKTVNQ